MAADASDIEQMPASGMLSRRRLTFGRPVRSVAVDQEQAATSEAPGESPNGVTLDRAAVHWLSTAHGGRATEARWRWYAEAEEPLCVPCGVAFSAVRVPAERGRVALGLLEGTGLFGPVACDVHPRVDAWVFFTPPSAAAIVEAVRRRHPRIDWSRVETRSRPVALDAHTTLWLPPLTRTDPARYQWVRPPSGAEPPLWDPRRLAQAVHSAYTPEAIDAAGAPAYGTSSPVRVMAR